MSSTPSRSSSPRTRSPQGRFRGCPRSGRSGSASSLLPPRHEPISSAVPTRARRTRTRSSASRSPSLTATFSARRQLGRMRRGVERGRLLARALKVVERLGQVLAAGVVVRAPRDGRRAWWRTASRKPRRPLREARAGGRAVGRERGLAQQSVAERVLRLRVVSNLADDVVGAQQRGQVRFQVVARSGAPAPVAGSCRTDHGGDLRQASRAGWRRSIRATRRLSSVGVRIRAPVTVGAQVWPRRTPLPSAKAFSSSSR